MSFIGVQLAKHLGAASREEIQDSAATIRPSSTANLAIDSLDRDQYPGSGTASDFTINKPQSLFNGFFTRLAMNEIVLDWCIPNISSYVDNVIFQVVTAGPVTTSISLQSGHYTVADVLDTIVVLLNSALGAGTFRLEDKYGAAWVTGTSYGPVFLATTGGANFTILPGPLQEQLDVQANVAGNAFPVTCPKLLPYYYVDFVSSQLTYNQDLKDNSTSLTNRDILYRWVFANENVPQALDRYGYPILQGYQPFVLRRYLSYPKQIAWDSKQPIGQLSFQVYTSDGDILNVAGLQGEMEYQMNLLVTEN